MQELLTFVAKSLVDHPEQVAVHVTEGPEAVILELNVAEADMGKVIGKQGRIAKAIRTIVKAATSKNSKPVFVEIQRPIDETEADDVLSEEAPDSMRQPASNPGSRIRRTRISAAVSGSTRSAEGTCTNSPRYPSSF